MTLFEGSSLSKRLLFTTFSSCMIGKRQHKMDLWLFKQRGHFSFFEFDLFLDGWLNVGDSSALHANPLGGILFLCLIPHRLLWQRWRTLFLVHSWSCVCWNEPTTFQGHRLSGAIKSTFLVLPCRSSTWTGGSLVWKTLLELCHFFSLLEVHKGRTWATIHLLSLVWKWVRTSVVLPGCR